MKYSDSQDQDCDQCYLLTRLASCTLALPTAPWCRVGLYVMDLNVCQVTSALSVVVNTAPGFRARISLSTSQTWALTTTTITHTWKTMWSAELMIS